jgi:hypothetical protein
VAEASGEDAGAAGGGTAFAVGDGRGFSKSLVDRLRKKVETQRPSTRLVDEVKAKQAAGAAAASGASATTTPALAPAPASASNELSQEELRRRDVARNVDFLRVLAGEKSKLAADPSQSKDYVAFQGGGQKLGGDRTNLPTDTGMGVKKKVVTAEGKVAYAKGVTDSAGEREKRAAAALARLNSLGKMSAAAAGAGGGED